MEHALITGGAGFIGQALVKRFIARGWRVTGFDSLMRYAMQYFDDAPASDRLGLPQNPAS